MAYDYIKRAYGLDFTPGQRVHHTVTGKLGTVRRESRSANHYVMVLFTDYRHAVPCHPQELDIALNGAPRHE